MQNLSAALQPSGPAVHPYSKGGREQPQCPILQQRGAESSPSAPSCAAALALPSPHPSADQETAAPSILTRIPARRSRGAWGCARSR